MSIIAFLVWWRGLQESYVLFREIVFWIGVSLPSVVSIDLLPKYESGMI